MQYRDFFRPFRRAFLSLPKNSFCLHWKLLLPWRCLDPGFHKVNCKWHAPPEASVDLTFLKSCSDNILYIYYFFWHAILIYACPSVYRENIGYINIFAPNFSHLYVAFFCTEVASHILMNNWNIILEECKRGGYSWGVDQRYL